MRLLPLALAALAAGRANADITSLACSVRQVGLDFAASLQPFRSADVFSEVADALNGAADAAGCVVKPSASRALPATSSKSRVLAYPLPKSGLVVHVDPVYGADKTADGTSGLPFATLEAALAHVRNTRRAAGIDAATATEKAHLLLRRGTFHLAQTLQLTRDDSNVMFQAYPGEEVYISGAVPLDGVTWTQAVAPQRSAYEYRAGVLAEGFDVAPMGSYTIQQAQDTCNSIPACAGFTYNSSDASPSGPVTVAFKYAIYYSRQGGSSVYVKNPGYTPGSSPNIWVADLSGIPLSSPDHDITALRVNGQRATLARYPNVVNPEWQGAMQIIADSWTGQPFNTAANYTFNPAQPSRNDSIPDNDGVPYFGTFKLGVGGNCSFRFTPQASYWCAEGTQGGGPGPYSAPVGMVVGNGNESLPHTPYQSDLSRANVHTWRVSRWFSWVFAVESASWDASSQKTTFAFSLTKGGNQGSRGANQGEEFFIENVLDELDYPNEFYYDPSTQKLFLWYNSTDGTNSPPPNAGGVVAAPQLDVLINATGTQADPVVGVGFLGLGFRDSSPTFLAPHGTPSGGDWALQRTAALFFEGTVGTQISGCLLTRLDGNAVFFSGYNRNASVTQNEFAWIGETAIAQWGYTDGSPVPGMGFDATAGNQPRGTVVAYNYVHEVGLWTKQNSFYFQSESFGNRIEGNIAFNGPRAGVNFDDGMGGGSVLTRNVLFNFCRESSDHAPFNSWNRQVYLVDGPGGTGGAPTTAKLNDTISHNWILGNYHSSMAVDNDDGSSFYDTHHNVLISASQGAAYGGNSLKSDFGGHSNYHHDNVDLFWNKGFGICGQLAGYADGYYNNVLYMTADGAYGSGQTCSGAGMTVVGNNTIYTPTGTVTECGQPLTTYQKSTGNDVGTTAAAYPADSVVLAAVHAVLGF